MTNSCSDRNYTLELLSTKTLTDFPSASAIECYNNHLYILGDDAPFLLITDTAYNRIDTIKFTTDTSFRIPRYRKHDIESSTLFQYNDQTYLYAFGSLSKANYALAYSFSLDSSRSFLQLDFKLDKPQKITNWNIEGSTFANDLLVFANRANQTNRMNHLLIINSYQTNRNSEFMTNGSITVIELDLPAKELAPGVSGLSYLAEKDILLFTASEENTGSTTEDGAIGNSYVGIVENFSKRLKKERIKPDRMINLVDVDHRFSTQKIESVCIERILEKEVIIHLAADNDNGESKLFKMKLSW